MSIDVKTLALAKAYANKVVGSGISEEDIATAVERYLAENPVETPDVDLTGVVKSVNGTTPDENGNVEVFIPDSSQNATCGLSATAANLLIEILESAVYGANVSGKIASLKDALASGGGSGDTPGIEPVADDITVADCVMTIVAVGSAITVYDGVITIA